MPVSRRNLLAASAAFVSSTASLPLMAQAAAWPARPVTVVVPFAAGGSVDTAARMLTHTLGERTGQSLVVDNTPGAGGTLGTQRVVRAPADGHTLLFAVSSPITVAPLVKPSLVKYDAARELIAVANVAMSPFVLIGRTQLPAQNMAELLDLARKSPGKLNYGTDGVGTTMHLTAEIIKLKGGVDIVHVPYKSGPQVLTELAAGLLDLAVMPITLAQPFIKDGKARAFGVTSAQRWPSLPQVPALAETPALKGLDVNSWYGVFAPAGTQRAVVQQISHAIADALKTPDLTAKMHEAGLKPQFMPEAEFTQLLRHEHETLAAAVRAAQIKPE